MKTEIKKYLLVACALFLGGLFTGILGIAQDSSFIRTASPAFEFPIPAPFRLQKPQFNEIFRAVNPATRLPITITVYPLKLRRSVESEYDFLRKRVMKTIMGTGICRELKPYQFEAIADFKGFPAYSFNFDCLLKGRPLTIKTNLLTITKEGKFISLFGMAFGNIDEIKRHFKQIIL